MSFFKMNENIHKKDGESDYVVSAKHPNQWPCNGLASKARGKQAILL